MEKNIVKGLELITMDESLPDDVIERNFPDLWVTMLTLCAFVTMDNAVDIYFGMIKEKWYAAAHVAKRRDLRVCSHRSFGGTRQHCQP